jgi:allantoicase
MIPPSESGHSNYAVFDPETGVVRQVGTYPDTMIAELLLRGEPILPITAQLGDRIDLATGEIVPPPPGVTLGARVFQGPIRPPD